MHAALVAILLAVLSLYSPAYAHAPDARRIAEATADVLEDDAAAALEGDVGHAPVFGSYVEDGAAQVLWAIRESSVDLHAVGDGGRSFGAWQLQQAAGRGNAWRQARAWRDLLLVGRKRCPAGPAAVMWGDCVVPTAEGPSSRTMARRRVDVARALLSRALSRAVL